MAGSNNPVFARSEAFTGSPAAADQRTMSASQLQDLYNAPPAARAGRMTYDEVVAKTAIVFVVLLAGAAVGWYQPGLAIVGLIGGLVLGLVNAFRKEPSPPLILGYAGLEGLFLGGISQAFASRWDGIVQQAVLATLSVFAVALFAYASGRVRVTPKFQRMVLIGMGGYLVFALASMVAGFLGVGDGWGFRTGGLGIVVGLFAVGLAAMMLVLDFDFIGQGVRQGLPAKYAWTAAFGLTVTLVWLYIELLRLIAILRGD